MNKIIQYFSDVPDSHRLYLLAAALILFNFIEFLYQARSNYNKPRHFLLNALFMVTAAPVQFLLGYLLIQVVNWDSINHFGLLNLVSGVHPLVYFAISLVLLDFCEYVYHVIMHKVKRLWMFHAVHHSDRVVDTSTTLREHPGETFVRLTFLLLSVFLLGVSFWALLFRQFVQIVANVFVHSKFRFSPISDRVISTVFITPNAHQVHHHNKQPFTDSNYGDILSIWDRLFKTFRTMEPEDLNFGVDTYMEHKDNAQFNSLLKIPFGKYRPPGTDQ